jgi:hypothetical protein
VGAIVLSAVSSPAGAAEKGSPHLLGIVPRTAHPHPPAPPRRATTATHFNCVVSCSAYEAAINQYFTDVAAANGATDNVYSVATQYSGIQYSETFGGSYVDGSPYPTTKTCRDGFDTYCVTKPQLEAEIKRVISMPSHRWPIGSTTAVYFIFTPANVGVCRHPGTRRGNECTVNAFCAYHWSTSSFIYAVVADGAASEGNGCDTGQAPVGNAVDDTLSLISHEQNEAITDPYGDAWRANDGPNRDEIADLCAYDFGSTPLGGAPGAEYNQVINGHNYWLQLEYSNQDSGCVPYLGGPVTAPDPRDGVGPLAYQNGAVMTTNTIYAIYWVPAPPANKQLPAITGVAKVGKKLTASHGTWSNLPKFAYRWLRCSAAGTSCTGIAKATGSSYTLVKADAHHTLEVRVTAKNEAGRANAISAPSRVVKR